MTDFELFDLGDFALADGTVFPGAKLAYQTFGTLNERKDNAVLMTSAFTARIADTARWLGPGMALDPAETFIVVTGLFGNGQSSSPSNTAPPFDGPRFPNVTIADNVGAQARLLSERFGIGRLRLVTGFSMGALQTYHWAAHHPDMVERIAPLCGAARCSPHNYVFLAGLKAALLADQTFAGGDYIEQPAAGIAALARVDAGWLFSQAWFRDQLDLAALGYASMEDYLTEVTDKSFDGLDANDILAMIRTWQQADFAAGPHFGGDVARAFRAITARAFVMPSETDLFFPVADSAAEVAAMPNARLIPIPTIWGHLAGVYGMNADDTAFIDARLRELMAD